MSNTLITKKGRNQKHDIIEEIHNYGLLIDTREIFLHGEPGDNNEDSGVEFRMANKLLKNLRFLESAGDGPIIVHQHSIGGYIFDGLMIYDIIASCQCHIVFIMHGEACSMGSVIPQAADTRVIMPSCIFMIHEGSYDFSGTYKQVKSSSQMWQKIQERFLDIYTPVCINGHFFQKEQADDKYVRSYIQEKMDQKEDWWLSAREAVAFGFADAVLGDNGYETIDNIRNLINEYRQ